MKLHNTDNATSFDTKEECQQWIDDRVVRFKLKMVPAQYPDGTPTFVQQKVDGKIISKVAEGFKESGTDEPLSNYAEPVKKDDKWMAVMFVR